MKTTFTTLLLSCILSVSLSAQTQSARDLIEQFRYKEAIEWLDSQPETAENLLLKADCYEKLYNFIDAFSVYQRLLLSNPEDVQLLTSAAECASQVGDTESALKYWITADSLSPGSLFLQIKKSMAYFRNGNWQKTIESAQTVFESDSVPVLLRITGDAFHNLNDPIWANYYYTKAWEKNPADHLSLRRICEYFYAMGEDGFDTVAVMSEKYLTEINPNQKTIGQLNGMANYSLGNFDKAIERLEANVALGDSSYTTTYFLGMSNYGKSWYYEAIKWLDIAFGLNNKDVNLYYYYGTALGRTKKRDEAVAVLQEGMDKIDKMSEMLFDFDISMAEAYYQTNSFVKAIDYYLSAYKRKPDEHRLLYSVAQSYDKMEDYKKAIAAYERYIKTAPKNVDVAALAHNEDRKMNMENIFYISSFRRIKELQEKVFMEAGKK